jgi:Yip1-like protein
MADAAGFEQRRAQLVTRASNIVMKPAVEWPVIAAETADVAGLMRDYAAPLAVIPAIGRWIGLSVVGIPGLLGGTYRVGIVRGFVGAIISWVFALIAAYIAALVVEKLAPSFNSRGNTVQALKLVVYASTPVWVAGVLNLVPVLSPLVIIAALYAIYLFYLGLPAVMSTPADNVVPYMIVSALVVIVITIVLGACAALLSGAGAFATM